MKWHGDHWLWVGGPVPRGSNAITLGSIVIVREEHAESEELLRHELVHVRQFRDLGTALFVTRYISGYLKWRGRGYSHQGAYRRIPLEAEAYWKQRHDHD